MAQMIGSQIKPTCIEGILDSLDFSDLNVCVECIKGKQTKHKRLGANSSCVLELIHADICKPFPMALGMANDTLYHS